MARYTTKNLEAASKYMFQKRMGPLGSNTNAFDHDADNDKALTWIDLADVTSIEAIRVDTDSRIRVDHAAILGAREMVSFQLALSASETTQYFFIAKRAMTIRSISEVHDVANGATMTAFVGKVTGTKAPSAGTTTMVGTFNMNATARTVQNATLLAPTGFGTPNAGLVLAAGDRLAYIQSTAVTSLAGVVITVGLTPAYKEEVARYVMNANAGMADQSFFVALRDGIITGVSAVWSAAATDAGTVTIDVKKETGTSAPATGTSILAAALNVKTAANTVANPALAASAATLAVAAGDRLSIDFTGVLTALTGLVVCVYFAPTYTYVDVGFNLLANASQADQLAFIADRDYEIAEVAEVHSVAGNDAGAVTLTVGIVKGTTAAGGGTQALTTTFDLKNTANTVVFLGGTTLLHTRLLKAGDRIDLNYTGVLTTLAGVNVRISLIPR